MRNGMQPNDKICGASNDKSLIWSRIAESLGKTTKTTLVGTRYFGDTNHPESIEIIEQEYCHKKSPKCGPCPLMHHCSYYAESSFDYSELPTFADIFSGAGGLGLGFEQAEFNPKLSIDKDEWAVFTHSYNHPRKQGFSICEDIEVWLKDPKNHVKVDVLMGGPPCQSFSNANKQRKKNDSRDGLYKLFVESIPLFSPKIILIENVRGFEKVIPELEKLVKQKGYSTMVLKLNARDYGIPQNRSRVFTIGVNQRHYGKENSKDVLERIKQRINDAKSPEKALMEAISDLPSLKASRMKNNTSHESVENGYTIQKKTSEPSDYVKEINADTSPVLIFNHKARYNNDRDIEIFSRLNPGEDSTSESIKDINPYKSRDGIFKDKYYKLRPDVVCKTITAHMKHDCNMYIHPNQARGLTVREAARIQGFPDNYVFCGKLGAMYRQIGNAVPPPLANIIASAIRPEALLKKRVRVLDLCAGIGGFRAGCSLVKNPDIEFEVVGFAEIDKYAKKAYQSMYSTEREADIGDIKSFTRKDGDDFQGGFLKRSASRSKTIRVNVPNHDILFAGFPCQPFSIMGSDLGVHDMLDRGELIFDLVEIIREKKPSFFVLENVKGFATQNNGLLCDKVTKELSSIGEGYDVKTWILNASDFGVPQVRNRLFIVGLSKPIECDYLSEPIVVETTPYEKGVHSFLEKNADEKYYLSEKIKKTILSEGTGGWKAKPEINRFVARPLTKTMHKMHRASQDNYYSEAFINGKWNEKKQQVIETKEGKDRVRRITPYESLKIQGFPEDLIQKALKSGLSDTRIYMAAGNAVPPPLVTAVLNTLPLSQFIISQDVEEPILEEQNQQMMSSFDKLKTHLDEVFPAIWDEIDPHQVTTALLIQVKGTDVHPNQRHERHSKCKKTQIDLTGPLSTRNSDYISPAAAILPLSVLTGMHHPVRVYHPIDKIWIETRIKYNAQVVDLAPPGPGNERRLWGGTDPNSWTDNLWRHIGNEDNDKFPFIIFLREGWNDPRSFALPRSELLEQLLIENGPSKGIYEKETGRFAHLKGSPITSKVVISGPSINKETGHQFVYVVTWPDTRGVVKIGESKQIPMQRLNGYDVGPHQADMNLILLTSDCVNAEKEIQKRLKLAGYKIAIKGKKDLFRFPSGVNNADQVISIVKEVVNTMYPPPPNVRAFEPIIRSKSSWAYDKKE